MRAILIKMAILHSQPTVTLLLGSFLSFCGGKDTPPDLAPRDLRQPDLAQPADLTTPDLAPHDLAPPDLIDQAPPQG